LPHERAVPAARAAAVSSNRCAAAGRNLRRERRAVDYDAGQQAAWASLANDEAAFAARLAGQLTLIATMDGAPVAFASLRGNDHIDMLYVHPAVARQGVATSLVDALEKLARARGAAKLTVDASDTAKPFFDKLGYAAQQRNAIAVGNEWLGNVSMQKQLPAAQSESRVQ
jgi:putative acetyltransferase